MPHPFRHLTSVAPSLERLLGVDHDEDDLERLSWTEITRRPELEGRWVALHDCRYDREGKAAEGDLVDADDDLQSLCARVQGRWQNCQILFVR